MRPKIVFAVSQLILLSLTVYGFNVRLFLPSREAVKNEDRTEGSELRDYNDYSLTPLCGNKPINVFGGYICYCGNRGELC